MKPQPSEIFTFPTGAVLAGAAPFSVSDLDDALRFAPGLVCADGGANMLGARTPDAVIGDLDSLKERDVWAERLGERLLHVAEQDSTDLEKCIRHTSAPFLIGVGFLGGRIDHSLAALHALVATERPVVLIGEEDVVFAPPLAVTVSVEPGDRVSFYPLREITCIGGGGLRWPVDGLAMSAGGRIGTSNEATETEVSVRFDRRGALMILPKSRLASVLACLHPPAVSAD